MRPSSPRPVPLRAVVISVAALAVPVLVLVMFPDLAREDEGALVWVTALIPAFLLAYYRGLKGAALAVAGAMAVLSLTQAVVMLTGESAPSWKLLLVVVALYVAMCVGMGVLAEILHRERRAAEELALVDGLTGISNRRHADVTLDAQFAAAVRGRKLVVVLFDLDHFKQVNDQHGHEAGDATLRRFAEVLQQGTRRMDLSARFGGEEFISILSDIDVDKALVFANRVRETIEAERFPWGQLTVSAGLAAHQDGMGSHEVLVAAADRALYAAKQAGRNRVVAAAPSAAEALPRVGGEPVAATAEPAATGSRTLLLVDDDVQVLRILGRVLRRAGYQVVETSDPDEVIRRYQSPDPGIDLLITDVMMPRMSGLTMVERVLPHRPDLRVIYMSGYQQGGVSWGGLKGTAVAFIAKPIDSAALIATVARLLEQAPAGATAPTE